jgi:hypothetical protein
MQTIARKRNMRFDPPQSAISFAMIQVFLIEGLAYEIP